MIDTYSASLFKIQSLTSGLGLEQVLSSGVELTIVLLIPWSSRNEIDKVLFVSLNRDVVDRIHRSNSWLGNSVSQGGQNHTQAIFTLDSFFSL